MSSIAGNVALFSYLKTETYWRFTAETLSVVPLFVLMGQFAAKAGLSQALFSGGQRVAGALPRRHSHGRGRRLCRFRSHHGVLPRDSRDNGPGRAARVEAITTIPGHSPPALSPPAGRWASSSRRPLSSSFTP